MSEVAMFTTYDEDGIRAGRITLEKSPRSPYEVSAWNSRTGQSEWHRWHTTRIAAEADFLEACKNAK